MTGTGNPANPAAGGYPLGVGQFFSPGGPIKSNVFTQLAFDPRMNKQPLLQGSARTATGSEGAYSFKTDAGLVHGFIVQAQSQQTTDGSLYGCQFLFNPSIVTLQHGIDANSSMVLPQYRRQSADTGVYLVGLASTLDISLFFDRTYEVNTNPDKGGSYGFYRPLGTVAETKFEGSQILINDDPRIIGVEADINALYRVCGMTTPIPGVTWTNDPINGQAATTSTATLTGPMQQVPCYLMLGASLGQASAPYWYGYIDSLSVTYNHFSQAMVPMRAQVDIEMTMLPQATSTTGGASAPASSTLTNGTVPSQAGNTLGALGGNK